MQDARGHQTTPAKATMAPGRGTQASFHKSLTPVEKSWTKCIWKRFSCPEHQCREVAPHFFEDVSATVSALFFGKSAEPNWSGTVAEERAWKRGLGRVFGFVSAMLFLGPRGCGRVGKEEFVEWANIVGTGQWRDLLASMREVPHHPHHNQEQEIIRESCRVQSCAARASVSSPTGACWSHVGGIRE